MNEKNLVVQHNSIVEARYKLTVEEQRLIKTLVSRIRSDDEDFKSYEIHILELTRLLGITDDYYYSKLKKLTKKLRESSLCFTNGRGDEVQTGWLSSAIYRKGKGSVQLRFDPELKPYLLQLKSLFTSYELGNILRLKGMYSIRIYELLKQYEKIGRREFTLDRFKQILRIESEYPQYRDLKKYVLAPAEKEISEKTDISYRLFEQKEGRKVVGLVFEIKSNSKAKENGAIPMTPTSAVEVAPESGPARQLVGLGVARKTAEQLAKEYGEDHIREKIAYAQAQQQEGKLKNPAGFLVEAIKNGYQDTQAKERKAKTASPEERQEATRRQWEALKAKWSAWRKQRTEALIAALDPAALEREEAAFRASLAGNSALRKLVEKSAENAARQFRIHVAGRRAEFGLAEWARAVGADLSPFLELARIEGKL